MRRDRYVGRATVGRAARARRVALPGRSCVARWQLGLRRGRKRDPHRQRRRDIVVDSRRIYLGQGHARPHHASPCTAVPRVRLRTQQGLPVPAPQSGIAGMGTDVDPSTQLGVHGRSAVDWYPASTTRLRARIPILTLTRVTNPLATFRTAVVASALWTLFVWGTRVRNVGNDDTLGAGENAFPYLVCAGFI